MPMQELLYDWQVWAYFAVLAWALQKQLKKSASLSSISVAAGLVAITWTYIAVHDRV